MKEDCNSTSKADPSSERTLAGVAWYEEAMKPSRQRNMTQSQRDRLARSLRASRRERSLEGPLEVTAKSEARMDQNEQ